MADYDSALNDILQGLGPITVKEGESGYFSTPDTQLDPRLFLNPEHMRPPVRTWILTTLYAFWGKRYHRPRDWSKVWVAGSGISYQWKAARGNGDLDVLVGVDFDKFRMANPDYSAFSEYEMADHFNTELKTELWPRTADTVIGNSGDVNGTSLGDLSGHFEVTFYVNPNASDIREIHPYAAYDLTSNHWTVKPPVLPAHPMDLYPKQFWQAVDRERKTATGMISRYNGYTRQLKAMQPGSPGWLNTMHQMSLTVDQAKALFDDIHLGRKNAFSPNGGGYGDWYNFRWQAHKQDGTLAALNALAGAAHDARIQHETETYGAPLDDAHTALEKAEFWNRKN